MKYTFTNEQGETIEVSPERWGWSVKYRDGSELHQFGADGIFHRFAEIETEKVVAFIMTKLDDPTRRIDIVVSPSLQLFHFYRNFILNAATADEKHVRLYCFGWKDRETKATCYHYVLPDDRVVVGPEDITIGVDVK